MILLKNKKAFTLAEVLIVIVVIGVVAAITLPVLTKKYQEFVLKHQFKKAYSTFYNAIMKAQANLDMPVQCSYWMTSAEQPCSIICARKNDFGGCIAWTCSDGSPMPSDYNGPNTDCSVFHDELFKKVLKVVKYCPNKAVESGCLDNSYKGIDKVKQEQNPDTTQDPGQSLSDNNIKNNNPVFILSDGTIIIKHGNYNTSNQLYAIDINGLKKPNKWGYDIFTFRIRGNRNGILKLEPDDLAIEKGGKSGKNMLK